MKLFAFFTAAIAQELANGTDSRMYGAEESQGSAVDGCGGPNCVAMVESILQSTAELHAAQEAATIGHQAEREADQEEQQQLQANFEAVSKNYIFKLNLKKISKILKNRFNPCGQSDELVVILNFAKNGRAKRN